MQSFDQRIQQAELGQYRNIGQLMGMGYRKKKEPLTLESASYRLKTQNAITVSNMCYGGIFIFSYIVLKYQ